MSLYITNDTERGRLHVRSNTTTDNKSEVSIKIADEADVRLHLDRRGELIEVEVRGVRFTRPETERAEEPRALPASEDLAEAAERVEEPKEFAEAEGRWGNGPLGDGPS